MNLRDAIRYVRQRGGTVTAPRRTGEVLFRHPGLKRRVRHHARRKDASRALRVWMRRIKQKGCR